MRLYACHNREPFRQTVEMHSPAVVDGQVVATTTTIPFRMRQDCSYTHTELGQADERCVGCSWRATTPNHTP